MNSGNELEVFLSAPNSSIYMWQGHPGGSMLPNLVKPFVSVGDVREGSVMMTGWNHPAATLTREGLRGQAKEQDYSGPLDSCVSV